MLKNILAFTLFAGVAACGPPPPDDEQPPPPPPPDTEWPEDTLRSQQTDVSVDIVDLFDEES